MNIFNKKYVFLILSFLLFAFLPAHNFKSIDIPFTNSNLSVMLNDDLIMQGEILHITVNPQTYLNSDILGKLNQSDLKFLKNGATYHALYGIDLTDDLKTSFVNIVSSRLFNIDTAIFPISVSKGIYEEQRIKVPAKMVNPTGKDLVRTINEAELLKDVYSKTKKTQTWDRPFILPLNGRLSSKFGLKRFYNNIPKKPHNGLDIAAPKGTKVMASNNGIVVLAQDLYYSGNTVIIDHGLGLYTAYYHMSTLNVEVNDFVEQTQIIGRVGTTGRSTGPHLHWAVKLNGARVNPDNLISISKEIFSQS